LSCTEIAAKARDPWSGCIFRDIRHDTRHDDWECPNPGKKTGAVLDLHADAEGWVHPAKDKAGSHYQSGGRSWGTRDVSLNVQKREVPLSEVVPDVFIHMHPVAEKISGKHEDRVRKAPLKDFATFGEKTTWRHGPGGKEDTSTTLRTLRKAARARCDWPNKITTRSQYGQYPDYQVTKDKVYIRSDSPDKVFTSLEGKITNSPVGMTKFNAS